MATSISPNTSTMTVSGSGFYPTGTVSITVTVAGNAPSVYNTTADANGNIYVQIAVATITGILSGAPTTMYATDLRTGDRSNVVTIPVATSTVWSTTPGDEVSASTWTTTAPYGSNYNPYPGPNGRNTYRGVGYYSAWLYANKNNWPQQFQGLDEIYVNSADAWYFWAQLNNPGYYGNILPNGVAALQNSM